MCCKYVTQVEPRNALIQGRRKHYKSGAYGLRGTLVGFWGSEIEPFVLGVIHLMKRQNILHDEGLLMSQSLNVNQPG